MTVADFCERHCRAKLDLDVRRFVQFGILKGLLRYRGHHRYVARFVTHGPPHFVLAVVLGFLLALCVGIFAVAVQRRSEGATRAL